ncbi:MAG: hypothetical protein J6B55_02705 [Clostridia bacterium]|nr:hypothetical protein [Clostridia bacterium]
MNEYIFRYLEKDEFESRGAELFALMYSNMSVIAPFKNSYEVEEADWFRLYGGAFKNRAERKIVVIETHGSVKGFFGYCADGEVFDMEEIQFSPDIQGKSGLFRRLYGLVLGDIPHTVKYVEACANKENIRSQAILSRLGLKKTGQDDEKGIFFFRGELADLLNWYNKKTTFFEGNNVTKL